jgi:hypothetical protein
MFVALYLPSLPPNSTREPSIAGFATEKCAYDYVYSQMCRGCKEERQAALDGVTEWDTFVDDDGFTHSHEPSLYPGCACEWDVISEDKFTAEELARFAPREHR